MKTIAAAALIAAQLATAAPASAVELIDSSATATTRMGTFAGARASVALGGKQESARLGIAIAPLQRSQNGQGEMKLRFGEGVEFGIAGRQPPALRLAGHRIAPGGVLVDDRGRRLGVSTLGAAGIAAGVIVAGLVVLALAVRSDADD
jgi:hypothetical protein